MEIPEEELKFSTLIQKHPSSETWTTSNFPDTVILVFPENKVSLNLPNAVTIFSGSCLISSKGLGDVLMSSEFVRSSFTCGYLKDLINSV